MSADNGVYVLETEGPEYRVAHLQAVENLSWDKSKEDYTDDPEVHISNAREMWANTPVFTSKEKAVKYASEVAEDYPYLEYGIQILKVPKKF